MGRGTDDGVVRVAAVGDLHCTRTSTGAFQSLFAAVAREADVLVLAGDLTDYGVPEEAEILVGEMTAAARVPTLAVLGNHDFETARQDEVVRVFAEAGITILDGESVEIRGIGFAGAKGFAGGFGRGTLGSWGEPPIKAFVQEAIDEAMKLESALARLRTPKRFVVLHYAPIVETIVGEPTEIFPWLGCSRLEEPLNRYPATVVVHGHAHRGAPEGRTAGGVPVYNVSAPLLRSHFPDRPPFRLFEIDAAPDRPAEASEAGPA